MQGDRDPLAEALREWWCDTLVPPRVNEFRAILARHGLAVVPVGQAEAVYLRLQRLTSMGTATVEAWLTMPEEVADLRRQIFQEADFATLLAGGWLRSERRALVAAAQQEARDADQG